MTAGSSRSRSQYQGSSRASPVAGLSMTCGRRSAAGASMTWKVTVGAMPVYALGDRVPQIDESAFVHPDAVVIGNVVIGAESSVWPNAVLRGDYGHITVGARTSVQDGTVVHCTA